MAALDRMGAVPLGGQAVVVTDIRIIAAHGIDVKEGTLPNSRDGHYLQVVDIANGAAWLLPASQQLLRQLGAQCQRAGGIAQPVTESEGL